MKQGNTIEVSGISKSFKIYYDKGNTFKERLLFRKRRKYEERQVINDISFDVKKGEAVGLIGQNGCGKSTTLKLLSRIMYPNSGKIEILGRVSSLLELGAGFHPDMSGKENIYINASIFGLTKKEIDNRIDDIIDFSELKEFIDNPVRTYSTGMYMRLAFSVAINVDADVLLIDEILAVGDANFQAKCFNKLREIKRKGTTIVIVSHDTASIEKFCDKAIWINKGKIALSGKPNAVINSYLDFIMNRNVVSLKKDKPKIAEEQSKKNKAPIEEKDDRYKILGNQFVEFKDFALLDGITEKNKDTFRIGDSIKIRARYIRNNNEIEDAVFGVGIFRNDGTHCYGTNTYIDSGEKVKINESGELCIILKNILLLKGHYLIDLALHNEFGQTYHHVSGAMEFDLYDNINEVGITRIEHIWVEDKTEKNNYLH